MPKALIQISHRLGSYRVVFGTYDEAIQAIPSRALVISDSNVFGHWGDALSGRWPVLKVPPGEASKSLECYRGCLTWLLQQGADRQSTIVALGGGVVGDLAGFVAATFMRGVRYMQIPTTLLAQVDSSVGGKVAIDLPEGKNLVGSFYPPSEVWICLETLWTLPRRQFVNGLAEVWKYGFIRDRGLVEILQQATLEPDSPSLEPTVRRCIELKTQVVEQDELDLTGSRAILNFGHTIGHAIEALSHYEGVLHGEAISMGMVAEAAIGERIGFTRPGTKSFIERCLAKDGLPTRSPLFLAPELLEAIHRDKKTESGEWAMSLISEIGGCKLVRNVPQDEVKAALSAL